MGNANTARRQESNELNGIYRLRIYLLHPHHGTSTQRFELDESITIGRGIHNDLVLKGERVSRHHATFGVTNGACWVEDKSKNGVWINGKRCMGGMRYHLSETDSVSIGHFSLRARAFDLTFNSNEPTQEAAEITRESHRSRTQSAPRSAVQTAYLHALRQNLTPLRQQLA